MKRIAPIALGALLIAPAAGAAPAWTLISFSARPQDAPRILKAADELMASAVGQEFPGKLLLQVHVADGANPASHSFVPIYRTVGQREAFVQKLQADEAWDEFLEVMTDASQPVSQTVYRNLKSWGDVVETDHVWAVHSFDVSDPAAFLAAIEAFLASPTGQAFPGQVYLSAVVAGGISPVSHVISVGYASEVEMEGWIQTRDASADWARYLEASAPAAEFLGTSLARDLKSWGPATLKQITAP